MAGRKRQVKVVECCPLFTEALHAKGSFVEGFVVPMKSGERWSARYAFHVPARGRGSARKTARELVIEHCPFCGTSPPKAGPKSEGASP